MDEQFWQNKWKSNQIAFHNAEANPLLTRNFSVLGLSEDARVFVPLCGKSRDLQWLMSRGHRVVGAELSGIAVEQLFGELGVTPRITAVGPLQQYDAENIAIFQGSIFDVTPGMLGPIDAVYDRAALVALPQEMRERYAAHMVELTARAPQLLICYEYDQSCADGPPFSVTEAELRRIYAQMPGLQLLERQAVLGGLKGRCASSEAVWRLQ